MARLDAGLLAFRPRRPNTLDWQVRAFGGDSWKVHTKNDGVWLVNENGGNPSYLEPSPISTPAMSQSSSSFPTPTPTPRPRPTSTPYPPNTYSMGGLNDKPPQISIQSGTTVTWFNNGGNSQSVESCSDKYCLEFSGRWASGEISPGSSFSRLFDSTGTFYYRKNGYSSLDSFVHVTHQSASTGTSNGGNPLPGNVVSSAHINGCPTRLPEYIHLDGLWSICIPSNWSMAPVPGQEDWDMYWGRPPGSGKIFLGISRWENLNVDDLEAVTDLLVDLIDEKSLELEVTYDERFDWNGRVANLLQIDAKNTLLERTSRYVLVVVGDGYLYSLEAFSHAIDWNQQESLFREILDSFLVA